MKVFDMAEYFWIQKKDNEGKTIALENRCRVSGESVAEKLHEMDLTKSRFLAQNQVFSLGKFFGNAKSINILLKGFIRERDEAGRNIPFTLVKEFYPKDHYRNYIRNLNEELKDVFEAAGLNKNEIDDVALNRNLEKIEEANKVYISNQGATLWQKKINLKNRNVAA